jgi:hypothetical protein
MIKGLEFESQWGQEFSLLHVIKIGSGAYLASYPMGTKGSSLGIKQQGHEADPLTSN